LYGEQASNREAGQCATRCVTLAKGQRPQAASGRRYTGLVAGGERDRGQCSRSRRCSSGRGQHDGQIPKRRDVVRGLGLCRAMRADRLPVPCRYLCRSCVIRRTGMQDAGRIRISRTYSPSKLMRAVSSCGPNAGLSNAPTPGTNVLGDWRCIMTAYPRLSKCHSCSTPIAISMPRFSGRLAFPESGSPQLLLSDAQGRSVFTAGGKADLDMRTIKRTVIASVSGVDPCLPSPRAKLEPISIG